MKQAPLTKICATCGLEKPLSAFAKDSYAPMGRRGQCYNCINARRRKYYEKTAQTRRDYAKEYYYQNHEHLLNMAKGRYYGVNHDKILAQNRVSGKKWRELHLTKVREVAKIRCRKSRARNRIYVLSLLCSGKPQCVMCGTTDINTLTIDHINNDGYKERKNGRAGNGLYSRIMAQYRRQGYIPPDLQCLCYNCQALKARKYWGQTDLNDFYCEIKDMVKYR